MLIPAVPATTDRAAVVNDATTEAPATTATATDTTLTVAENQNLVLLKKKKQQHSLWTTSNKLMVNTIMSKKMVHTNKLCCFS